jgi:DNA ligase-1
MSSLPNPCRVRMHRCFLFLLLLLLGSICPPARALEITLPTVYQAGTNVSGWLMSEKLDGVRGYWDGGHLLSKTGKPFHPPAAFTANFPDFPLEGEIWGGRRTFERTVGIVKKKKPDPGWLQLKFAIFEVPKAPGGFEERLHVAKAWFARHPSSYAFVIEQSPVKDSVQLRQELHRIEKLGGEGIILRRPGSSYTAGRTSDYLKVKNYDDTEAVVVAHLVGRGRNTGRMGSLLVELPNGVRFKIGTGFSDAIRENPPPIGSVITFKFYGFYKSGIPKFPSFLRVREEF